MAKLTPEGEKIVAALADRYSVGVDAVKMMLDAVARGGGSMAQFNLPEFGGNGQWMRGGMTMVGDMFNNSMKATVDNLCNDLSRVLESQPNIMTVFAPQSHRARAREVAAQVSGSPPSRDRGGRPSWGVPRRPGRRTVCGTPIFPAATGWRSMIAGASKSMTPLATTLAVSVSNKAAMLRSLSRVAARRCSRRQIAACHERERLPPKHAPLQLRSRHLLPPALIPARS